MNKTSPILMADFKRQWQDLEPRAVETFRAFGASGWYILGEGTASFEKALSQWWAPELQTFGYGNCLDATVAALESLDLPVGAKVLTTPLTAFATTLAVLRAGLHPVFVDVDSAGLLDLDLAEKALAADAEIKAILPVHLYGSALDLDRLAGLSGRVAVVEDCAQSLGCSWRGRPAGTAGAMAVTSFYPTKNLGCFGDGGAAATSNPALATRLREKRDYGQSAKYVHTEYGMNSRLDELQAMLLERVLLPKLTGYIQRRREVADIYDAKLSNPAIRPIPVPADCQPARHLYPVRVAAGRRDALCRHLKERNIGTAIHYPSLTCDQAAMAGRPFTILGELPHARAIATEEVSLPLHPYLTDAEVDQVIAAVQSFS